MRTSTVFGAKKFGFFEFKVCPHGQGGWASADKGGGVNLSRFCAEVFYGWP